MVMKNNFSFEQNELTKLKSNEELLIACRQQIQLEPHNPENYLGLGNLLLQDSNQLEEALEAYQKSISLSSSNNRLAAYQGITRVIKQAVSVAKINQPPYEKIILYAGIGGLCNRLRSLCSYLVLRDFLDIPLFICWDTEEACNCYFSELFEPICETISPQSMLQFFSSKNASQILYVYVGVDAYKTYLEDNIYIGTFRTQYLEYIRKIKAKSHFLQEIEEFKQQHWTDTDHIVGLHIRRTDLYPHMKSRNLQSKFSSDENFISAIEKEIDNGCSKFFLATDNEITQNIIHNNFPGKIISYCHTFNNKNKRHTSVENALIDLYLLSNCQKIIGSYYSSFSEYAADLGNVPLIYA